MEKTENYFFKYFTINQNFYNSLINNELYFSSPRNFNDPFDTLPRFKLCSDIKKLEFFYLFIQNHINEKTEIIKNLKNFAKKKLDFEKLLKVFLEDLNEFNTSVHLK